MKSGKFTLCLPGDHWGDLPRGLDSPTAANLLACWTALWHPQLLTATRAIPGTASVGELLTGGASDDQLTLLPQATSATDLADSPHRTAVVDKPLTRADVWKDLAEHTGPLDPQAPGVQELAALGFAYQQVEALTRAMHYDGLLRHELFAAAAIEAAEAALEGNTERMSSRLDDAYDLLMQARNHYYPVDFYLVDIGLVAPSACDAAFVAACERGSATNLLITGEALRQLEVSNPAAVAAIRDAIEQKRMSICGGSDTDRPLSRLTGEEMLADLRRGLETCERLLGVRPQVFAHYAGPLAPLVPGLLYRLGYLGVVQANFAGLPTPRTLHNRTAWCGPDGIHIEALNAVPLDTGDSRALLELATTTSRSMDYELAATLLLAGWPGHRCESYGDLCEVARRSSVLGRMVRLDDYFEQTTSYDHAGPLEFDEYPDPPLPAVGDQDQTTSHSTPSQPSRLAMLARVAGSDATDPTQNLAALLGAEVARGREDGGLLLVNGNSFSSEAPGFGWSWIPPSRAKTLKGDDTQLVNASIEVHINPATGGLSAVRLHGKRGNQMSQRLVLLPPSGRTYAVADEFEIAIDRIEALPLNDSRVGVTAHGRIVDRQGQAMAELRQTTTVGRHASRVDIEVELTWGTADGPRPMVASQLAFRDLGAPLRRGVQGISLPTSRTRMVSHWVQVASEQIPLAIVSRRPYRHYRHHEQQIDTLLFEHPGTTSRAELSYVIDARYPTQSYFEIAYPEHRAELPTTPPAQEEGWWLNLGARNVVATHLAVEEHSDDALLRLRILETEGRPAQVRLAGWRPFADAHQVDFTGQAEQLLRVREGNIELSLAPYEWVEIIAAWEP